MFVNDSNSGMEGVFTVIDGETYTSVGVVPLCSVLRIHYGAGRIATLPSMSMDKQKLPRGSRLGHDRHIVSLSPSSPTHKSPTYRTRPPPTPPPPGVHEESVMSFLSTMKGTNYFTITNYSFCSIKIYNSKIQKLSKKQHNSNLLQSVWDPPIHRLIKKREIASVPLKFIAILFVPLNFTNPLMCHYS